MVVSSNDTVVQCQLSLQADVEPGVLLPASMQVNNLGAAVFSITGEKGKSFIMNPRISALSEHSGSLGGGQHLTITGIPTNHLLLVLGDIC